MTEAKTTTNHDEIKAWVEERGGRPARVESTAPDGVLRIDFGEPEENLEEIDWADFFRIFEENDLRFLFQERTEDGDISRFSKFIERN